MFELHLFEQLMTLPCVCAVLYIIISVVYCKREMCSDPVPGNVT